ncbi:SH3 domain-containing protein [Streptomyces sp. SID5785]|uniref:SH3 domain-containing protein n=1 Tax=Streptomyces sp. SID5785 TaxID=2690309 RepID=UPI0013618182|nr:SH3 domain-containing protein [Streptomyces sp. SID5785]MZD06754.1 SH3 domain-containing protein [Streptomyces sp. SID5785]
MRRTTPAVAAATLVAGGVLAVTAAAPASAGNGGGDVVWGTVVSRGDLNLRSGPSTSDPVVYKLAPGSQDRIECATNGSSVHGDPAWFWLIGARGWASAAYIDTDGRSVPSCTTPCPPDHPQRDSSPSGFWFRSDTSIEFGVRY